MNMPEKTASDLLIEYLGNTHAGQGEMQELAEQLGLLPESIPEGKIGFEKAKVLVNLARQGSQSEGNRIDALITLLATRYPGSPVLRALGRIKDDGSLSVISKGYEEEALRAEILLRAVDEARAEGRAPDWLWRVFLRRKRRE